MKTLFPALALTTLASLAGFAPQASAVTPVFNNLQPVRASVTLGNHGPGEPYTFSNLNYCVASYNNEGKFIFSDTGGINAMPDCLRLRDGGLGGPRSPWRGTPP